MSDYANNLLYLLNIVKNAGIKFQTSRENLMGTGKFNVYGVIGVLKPL